MAAFLGLVPLAVQLVQGLLNQRSEKPTENSAPTPTVAPAPHSTRNHELEEYQREAQQHNREMQEQNEALREELKNYRKEHKALLERFDSLLAQMKKKKIESFDDLAAQDREAKNVLIQLAQQTRPQPLQGYNVGLFGITSTGKSTMLNSLLGEKKAATGAGETTIEVTPYQGRGYILWDVPGRNDEVSYMSMEYISFFKGLSKKMILIQATVKENSSLMKMLDAIGVDYDIVFNKFDQIDEEERPKVKQQIDAEVKKLGLQRVKKIYFVSAKNPNMFPEWLTMVHDLTS